MVLELPHRDFRRARDRFPLPVLETQSSVEIFTDDVNGAINALLAHEVPLAHLTIRARTLEDLFLELTGKELRA